MNNISYKIIEEGGSKEVRDILRKLFKDFNGENIDDHALRI